MNAGRGGVRRTNVIPLMVFCLLLTLRRRSQWRGSRRTRGHIPRREALDRADCSGRSSALLQVCYHRAGFSLTILFQFLVCTWYELRVVFCRLSVRDVYCHNSTTSLFALRCIALYRCKLSSLTQSFHPSAHRVNSQLGRTLTRRASRPRTFLLVSAHREVCTGSSHCMRERGYFVSSDYASFLSSSGRVFSGRLKVAPSLSGKDLRKFDPESSR